MDESVIGKFLWIEMEPDKSAVVFAPRRGEILAIWEEPQMREWGLVRLEPPASMSLPVPRRLHHIVLGYTRSDPQIITQVFRAGYAWAEVLRLRGLHAPVRGPIGADRLRRLGFAKVFPWPKPTPVEFKEMVRRANAT